MYLLGPFLRPYGASGDKKYVLNINLRKNIGFLYFHLFEKMKFSKEDKDPETNRYKETDFDSALTAAEAPRRLLKGAVAKMAPPKLFLQFGQVPYSRHYMSKESRASDG